ncbi:MAG: hypothetical protein J0L92_04470 [Deltaproteobacteria bacterium]|nr:hypothetical protein [Deltaproteobacteria bacterium]
MHRGLVAGTMVRGEIHQATLESLQLEARGTSGCVYAGGVVGHATGVTIGEIAVSGSLLPSEGGYGGAFGLLGDRSMVSDLRITMSVPDVMSAVCDGHGGAVGQLRGDAQVRACWSSATSPAAAGSWAT